jgi:leucyl-tRNA synthetase
MDYKPHEIEKKWQSFWVENEVYKVVTDHSKPKYYVLDMFPYPSGAGLHVGHPLGYIASDIYSRYKRHLGFNVLHPMGYDAFGLPAEQYAIQTGVHPAVSTAENISGFRKQMDNIGFSYDWSREVNTSDPSYYKWTQWIFLKMYDHYYDLTQNKARPIEALIQEFERSGNKEVKSVHSQDSTFSAESWKNMTPLQQNEVLMNYRLAYRKTGYVNWCEALGTVLANDEVKDGVSERGGYPVERRAMKQWSIRTTAYAERLLEGLDQVEWPESLKLMQRHWIGKSTGASIKFSLKDYSENIEVFTTRPDTIYGSTFMVLAPDHDLVEKITTSAQKEDVKKYQEYTSSRSERDRLSEVKKVTGVFTGAYAIHPFTKKEIPVWIADYVLKDYGTGAIMAVPSDDSRDNAFAKNFELPIIEIVDRSNFPGAELGDKVGKMMNSGPFDGLEVKDAIEKAITTIENKGIGERQINYKLRDANFSRQRYWGEPFPIVYDEEGIITPLNENDLPVELPELQYFMPSTDGKAPLSKIEDWVKYDDRHSREVDTMPGFAGSSWYFLRYMDPHNDQAFVSEEAIMYWQEVDLYIGGAEHAVGHLLYARTWHKFLKDLGLVPTEEPFKKLINQGMIQGVSEKLYMLKGKRKEVSWLVNGQLKELIFPSVSAVFLSADIIGQFDKGDLTEIYVPVEYLNDYGTYDKAWLSDSGIKKFLAWRPEFKGAAFLFSHGFWFNGNFQIVENEEQRRIYTHSEVEKMSKSKYNVINPDHVIADYGADCFRMYEMFLGPIEQSKPWDINGIDGVYKFLRKIWSLYFDEKGEVNLSKNPATKEELKVLHTAIRKIREDIEKFSFNTCISAFMICVNELKKLNTQTREVLEPLVILLSPFAPHMAEELWHRLGYVQSIVNSPYPDYKEEYLVADEITYPLSVNGKKKALIELGAELSVEEIEIIARNHPDLGKWLNGSIIKKVIVVKGRMINIVAG